MSKQEKQAKTHRHREQYGGNHRNVGWEIVKGKGGEIHGDGKTILGGGHTIQYTSDVSQKHLKTIILLTNATTINLIKYYGTF